MVGAYISDKDIPNRGGLGIANNLTANLDAMLWRFAFGPVLSAAPLLGSVPMATGGTFADVLAAPSPAQAFAGGVNAAGSYAQNIFTQNSRSWSVFTQNTLELTDRLGFVLGLRWIDERKDAAFFQPEAKNDACFNTLANFGALAAGAAGTGLEQVAGTIGAFSAGFACFPFAVPVDVAPGQPESFSGIYDDNELAWTTKLTYEFNDSTSGYASFTHGFKAGGFNLDPTAASGGASPQFGAETNDSFEVGLKSLLFDDRVRANFAVWNYDLEDFQVLEFTGVQFMTFNVPNAQSHGAELEMTASISQNLNLNLGYTYADSEYPDDCDGGVPNPPASVASLCGALMTNSPKNSVNLGFDYQNYIGSNQYFLSGNYRWVDERRTSTQPNLALDIMDATGLLNLRGGFGSEDGRWTVEVWGANLLDERIRTVTFNVPLRIGARAAFIAAPRTYGVTLRTTF
ncbi:MAG: TonB-dependent receptor, partial [Gammaproteobacteria bacterium]|nr:TonB-dependent receptor [Gammaproteobacteria bacterium]